MKNLIAKKTAQLQSTHTHSTTCMVRIGLYFWVFLLSSLLPCLCHPGPRRPTEAPSPPHPPPRNASVVTSGTPSNNSICRCSASFFWLAGARLLSIRRESKAARRREPLRSGWRLEERERWRRQALFNCTFAESRRAHVRS